MRSRRYILRHVLHAAATLLFVLAFNFVLFRAVGDPVKLLTRSSVHLDPQEQEALREEFVSPSELEPLYLRHTDAELNWDATAGWGRGAPASAAR